jgi:signal transduction histidine kinase
MPPSNMLNQSDGPTAGDALSSSLARNDAGDLYDHAEGVSEAGKAHLARALHDDLGGLLVGAIMDLAWAEQNWGPNAKEAREKITRARRSLSAAVDLMRKLVERLRPSLLENVGLFAALRWHVNTINAEMDIQGRIELPEGELGLSPPAAIVLFRSIQEAYGLFCAAHAGTVQITGSTDLGLLKVRIAATNIPGSHGHGHESQHALAAIRRRIVSLGGNSSMQHPSPSEMTFTASVPLLNILS